MDESKRLLQEAHKINYRLRSVFFYRKIHEYGTLEFPGTINDLLIHAHLYDWTNHEDWGISAKAFSSVEESQLELLQVFAHPKLLREYPHLVAYYRNVAVLSQKSVSYLAKVNVGPFEDQSRTNLSEAQAFAVAKLFNEHISLIIENALGEIKHEEIQGLLFASTGSQIDGSWRNAIGEEAEKVVQLMLTQEALRREILEAFIIRIDGTRAPVSEESTERVLRDIKSLKGLMLKNKKSILFSSEPDITILDTDGSSILIVEVKGGTDPAGALERYGAAKKSFSHSRGENENVVTCLVASCITDEVEGRIKADVSISSYYNLTRIMTDEDFRNSFLDYIFQHII